MGTYPSAQQELPNGYQHDRVKMVFKNLCVLILMTKAASALEGVRPSEHLMYNMLILLQFD